MSSIPVFVRGGCIIPRWPIQQYVGEIANPPVTLDLWWAPDTVQVSELYEDAGDGMAYRLGDYLLHKFTYHSSVRELSISHCMEGEQERAADSFELALHSLPHTATPTITVDGVELSGAFDDKHVFRVQISARFRDLTVSF
jgi:alpha-glucosidase